MANTNFTEFSEFEMNEDLYRDFMPSDGICAPATEFPVWRSVDISSQQMFNPFQAPSNHVEMPHLSKEPLSKPTLSVTTLHENSSPTSEYEDFEFFESSSCPPTLDDLGFCPLARTHFTLELNVDESKQAISNYLNTQGVFFKYSDSKFRWVCECERNFEVVKFEVQLYTCPDGVTVEFLRLRGASIVFSAIFRDCKCVLTSGVAAAPTSPRSIACMSGETVPQTSTTFVVEWIKSDPVEGTKALCGMISEKAVELSGDSNLMRNACAALVHSDLQAISGMSILSLARLLVDKHREESIPNFRNLIDILIPSVARNGCAAGTSDFMRNYSKNVMESISESL